MLYVYWDVFLLTNFVVDCSILYAVGRLAGASTAAWRLALAGALGAAYGLGFLFLNPAVPGLYGPPSRVISSLIILAVAYAPVPLALFLRLAVWLYAASAFVAGMAFVLNAQLRWWGLAGALLLLGAAALWGWRQARRALVRDPLLLPVEVCLRGKSAVLTGLLDTGNRLRDPLNLAPVIVVDLNALSGILPPAVRGIFTGGGVPEDAALATQDAALATRFRVLSFVSLGHGGLLYGFRPDSVILHDGDRRLEVADVTVAVSANPLAPGGEYQALIHPGLLRGEINSDVRGWCADGNALARMVG